MTGPLSAKRSIGVQGIEYIAWPGCPMSESKIHGYCHVYLCICVSKHLYIDISTCISICSHMFVCLYIYISVSIIHESSGLAKPISR